MATTIITKFGSGAPAASDVVRGELAVDTENGRLYTENIAGSVVEIGLNPSGNVDVTGTVTADGLTVGDSSSSFTLATIQSSTSGESELRMGDTDTDAGSISYTNSDDTMTFRAAAAARMSLNSTGLDVTGTVTADGLTVDGNPIINGTSPQLFFQTGASNYNWQLAAQENVSDAFEISSGAADASAPDDTYTKRLVIQNTGDISFYEDTGTTAKFFWDASAESLGIGTTSPAEVLHVTTSSGNSYLEVGRATQAQGEVGLKISGGTSGADWYLYQKPSADTLHFYKTGDRVTIDSSGNVGIGGITPTGLLTLGTGTFSAAAANTSALYTSTTAGLVAVADGLLLVDRAGADVFKVDTSGNVGIGTSSPNYVLNTNYNANATFSNASSDFTQMWQNSDINALGVALADDLTARLVVNNGYELAFNNGSTETLRIDSSGNLLVGTTTPNTTATLYAEGSSSNAFGFAADKDASSAGAAAFSRPDDGLVINFYRAWAGGGVGNISVTSTATAYNTSSDQRLKENIVDAPSASDDIDAIQVRSFDWKADGSHQKYGMVAQELVTVAPEAVSQPEDPEEMMGVDYSKLVPMMLKEIQSLRARVAQLEGAN